MEKIFTVILITSAIFIVLLLLLAIFLKYYKGHNRFLLFIRYKIFRMKKRKKYDAYYSVKPRYLSPIEDDYFKTLQSIIGKNYLIFPQVPLSQIIEKHSSNNLKSELFRVIDFCVFDLNYTPLLCIEINDTTHLKKERAERDSKVYDILKSAKLPLITLWTYEGINSEAIKKTLLKCGISKI